MTYKDLQDFLSTLTKEQLEMDVSIGVTKDMNSTLLSNNDDVEFFDYVLSGIEDEGSTLDANHPYLIVEIS